MLFGLLGWLALPLTGRTAPLRLRMATYHYPPYIYDNSAKQPSGMAVEIVEAAFGRMKTPITFKFAPFRRALAYLDHGLADALFTIRKTPERELHYHFSSLPLLTQDIVIFVRNDSLIQFTGKLEELSTYSIGVVDHTSYGAEFDKMAKISQFKKLEIATSHELNFKKLLANRMDVVVCSRNVGLEILRSLSSSSKVKVIGPPVGTYKSYIVFNKKTVLPDMIDNFNKKIIEMDRDGTLQQLRKKYGI